MSELTIGIDISKDRLDVHLLPEGLATQFPNTAPRFRDLARHLAKRHIARVVYEPTGPYHGAFERAAANRLPLVKVNPLQARRFAQARGTRAHQILCSIPGLGAVTAAAILIEMPEIGTLGLKTGRRPCRARADHPAIRAMAGQGLHSRRPKTPARRPLHAGPGRQPIQPRPCNEIQRHETSWKTRKSRDHHPHA